MMDEKVLVSNLPSEALQRQKAQDKVEQVRSNGKGFWRTFRLLWLLIGPGILVMIGDNDAGGVITYAQSGAQYGIGFFIPFLVLLIPVAYVVQEMTVRLGAVTGRGHGELIFERFGKFWGYFSLADLALGNLLTVITEFIGMGVGLGIFGVPLPIAVGISAVLVIAIALSKSYWTSERLVLGFAAFNLIFIPLAWMTHPSLSNIAHAFSNWSLPGGFTAKVLFLLIANVGTTIAPWMLFYQQSAVVDKGLTIKDIRYGRIDTAIGSVVMGAIAICIMIVSASTLYSHHVNVANFRPQDFLLALNHYLGSVGAGLFGIGLFEAGFVAAVTISLSSSWAFGEVFNWQRSLNAPLKAAPWFYGIYIATVVVAATVVLIPRAPLDLITQTVQVIATILMPPALAFLLLLLNDKELMGEHVNSRWTNGFVILIVASILVLSTVLGITTIFPHLIPA